jgi:putative ABC transport system substrate-binding protein
MDGGSRRPFLAAAISAFAAPFAVAQQQRAKARRLGYLAFNSLASGGHILAIFRSALGELGWTDGKDIIIETRFANGEVDRLPALANELLSLDVDVLLAGSSASTRACKAATATTPIVMLASADAVGEGLVASLARPGANITGVTFLAGPEIAGKQLELLREIAPAASRVAVLLNPRNASHAAFVVELKKASRTLAVQLQTVAADSPSQLANAFAVMEKERAAAMLVLTDAMFLGERRRITELARSGALPAMYSQREYVEAGGLASYGPSLTEMARQAAKHVDKILRGVRPRELPVEQPTKFELVLNLKAGKDLAIVIPHSLVARADEVIQ